MHSRKSKPCSFDVVLLDYFSLLKLCKLGRISAFLLRDSVEEFFFKTPASKNELGIYAPVLWSPGGLAF